MVTQEHPNIDSNSTMAQQIAAAATAFQQQRTGLAPHSVSVVIIDHTLVITLHGALSPAEQVLAKNPAGAASVREFHRELFTNSAETLRQEIKRITGVDVREATAEIEPTSGTVVQVFTTGTMVQVFLLAGSVPEETWRGSVQAGAVGMWETEGGSAAGVSRSGSLTVDQKNGG